MLFLFLLIELLSSPRVPAAAVSSPERLATEAHEPFSLDRYPRLLGVANNHKSMLRQLIRILTQIIHHVTWYSQR